MWQHTRKLGVKNQLQTQAEKGWCVSVCEWVITLFVCLFIFIFICFTIISIVRVFASAFFVVVNGVVVVVVVFVRFTSFGFTLTSVPIIVINLSFWKTSFIVDYFHILRLISCSGVWVKRNAVFCHHFWDNLRLCCIGIVSPIYNQMSQFDFD